MSNSGDFRSRYKFSRPNTPPRTDYVGPLPAPTKPEAVEQSQPTPKTFEPPKQSKPTRDKLHRTLFRNVKSRLPSNRDAYIAFGATATLFVVLMLAFLIGQGHGSHGPQGLTTANATQTIKASGEKPRFTVYYPSKLPTGLSIDAASVKSSKDSFDFNLQQGLSDKFFVTQQPVASNFTFDTMKQKLLTPTDFSIPLGKGIFGGLNGGLIYAVKSKDNTLIILNCTSTACLTTPKEVLQNLTIAKDLDHLPAN